MKDNKLIAEFMGLDSFKDSLASLHQGKINVDVDVYEQAQYHTSWDWLMPVIKTIRDHVNVDMGFEEYDNWRENFKQIDPYNYNLSECYKAVVEFIKTYNNEL
jgi:hypothetical protein